MTSQAPDRSEPGVHEVLEEYLAALDAGDAPDQKTLLDRHPDLAEALASALLGLELVRRGAKALAMPGGGGADAGAAAAGQVLGDYRLLREVGRGGMAVVYEAEQVSLGRRVALKGLPFAAVLDPKHLQRFKNEALAAAHLRHPNIVPVHAVGCERGVHYYAMQYVEGQSLALAIREMKGGGAGEGPRTPISSHGSNREPAYLRMAAALGMQAAEALDHAHQLGIVHRDVKPGNLLIDMAGTMWVTDFGLARSLNDVGLTITGELLGTIRYMSPEQALAKRVPLDHRTDVYSLGATLYELFTLEPAFPGDDPHVVIQDIALKEPVSPRRLNPALPTDLETVLLKAMAKDPAGRYATAQEMADDLKRYLEDKPVLARRPSLASRAVKWSRRHRGLVAASFVVLVLAVTGLAAYSIRVADEQRKTRTALGHARNAVDKFLVEAGVARMTDDPVPSPAKRALLQAALEFYGTSSEDPTSLHTRASILHALHRYGESLWAFDRVLDARPRDTRALVGRGHMLWHLERHGEALAALDRAIEIAPDYAEPHFHRGIALDASGHPEEALAAFREAARLQPDFALAHYSLGNALSGEGDRDGAIREWREAVRLQPDRAGTRFNLGNALHGHDLDGAIQEYREALHLEPDHAGARNNLGAALDAKGDADGAIRQWREAIRLDPDNADAHSNLGNALMKQDDHDGAIMEYREVIRIDPARAVARTNLGVALERKGDLDGAIRAHGEAIRLRPDYAEAHYNLGVALHKKYDLGNGDLDGAIVEFREALRLKPDLAEAHFDLGRALGSKGHVDDEIRGYHEAIRLQPSLVDAHYNLGIVLRDSGDPNGAILEWREAVRLRPDHVKAHYSLGTIMLAAEADLDGAILELREVIRLQPDHAEAQCNLGLALLRQERFQEALVWLRKGHEAGSKQPGWAYPSKGWLESAEAKAALEGRLHQALSGEARPRDARERIEFAELLCARALYAEAARMYAEAFAEDKALAEDLDAGHRYNAACCAARVAGRGGTDAAEWRGRALQWLRADLAARERTPVRLVATLEHWKRDPDLACVRDRLADLPADEREGWTKLWTAVDALLALARAEK